MEDTQIIALYLSRQEAAIGETAKKYGGYINRIAYNILRCREDTEEIAADTARNTPGTYTVVPAAALKSGWDERYSLNLPHWGPIWPGSPGIWPLTGWTTSLPNAEMCI